MTRASLLRATFGRLPLLALVATLGACGGSAPGPGPGPDPALPGDLGQVALELNVGPGVTLDAFNYLLTGPAGFSRSGTLNVAGTDKLVAIISPLPAGNGYTVTVSTGADAGLACTGTATFNINAGQTTAVALGIRCFEGKKQGSVQIDGTVNVCPIIDGVAATPARALVGGAVALTGAAHDLDTRPAALGFGWTTTSGMISSPTSPQAGFVCPGVGAFAITLQVTDGDCSDSAAITITCVAPDADAGASDAGAPDSAPPAVQVRINEIESNGGTPGDWVELFNLGSAPVDLSGYVFRDSEESRGYTLPAGTSIAAGGYLVLEEGAFGFGLGGADSARLFAPGGVTLVDGHSWTAHAAITYGRCPNGTGSFVPTASSKGALNACAVPDAGAIDTGATDTDTGATDTNPPTDGTVVVREAWPGRNQVVEVDTLNQFGDNLSGLTYQPASAGAPGVLWASLNSPSLIYRLVWNGSTFGFDSTGGWGAGKNITYPSGAGNPDFEGLTKAEWDSPFVYAATERNNDASGVSRLSILRVDTSAAGTTLVATHEWHLNADIPATGPNLGLEAITWVPDSYLTARQFRDERTGATYDPATYPNHGTGLFLTGVEGSGVIYAYALDHAAGTFQRVATIPSGHPSVMALEFDRDTGALWAQCDNTCANTANVLGVVGGRFVVRRSFARPSTLPDSNNEGLAIASSAECVLGLKPVYWSDDSHFGGHALRMDAISCTPPF